VKAVDISSLYRYNTHHKLNRFTAGDYYVPYNTRDNRIPLGHLPLLSVRCIYICRPAQWDSKTWSTWSGFFSSRSFETHTLFKLRRCTNDSFNSASHCLWRVGILFYLRVIYTLFHTLYAVTNSGLATAHPQYLYLPHGQGPMSF